MGLIDRRQREDGTWYDFPRCIRFVPAWKLPNGVLSVLDHETNVLLVAKEYYDTLNPMVQEIVIKSDAPMMRMA